MKQFLALVIGLAGLGSPAFAQKKPAPKAAAQKVAAETSASVLRGKPIYTQYCQSCHQADGGGGKATLKPPLSKTTLFIERSKVIFNLLGHVRFQNINGGRLTDQQVADVLTYVRNSFGNKASAIKPPEVKDMRRILFLKSGGNYENSATDTTSGW